MDSSLYKIRSLGKVASNKVRGSNDIEVMLTEHLPMADGEITANATTSTSKGVTPDGQAYETSSTSTATIPATWRPIGDSFRQTSPDVRRGDDVLVYQFADVDTYYWETVGDTHHRRLETIRFGITATQSESATIDNTNSYLQEWSSHDQYVTLISTSMANGEQSSYQFQFNPGQGVVVMQDAQGNGLLLDSLKNRWLLQTADGSIMDLNGKNVSITAPELLTLNATNAVFNFSETLAITASNSTNLTSDITTLNGATFNVNANTNLLGNFDLKGDMTSGAGASGTTGQLTLAKNVTILGDLEVGGRTHTKDLSVDSPPW